MNALQVFDCLPLGGPQVAANRVTFDELVARAQPALPAGEHEVHDMPLVVVVVDDVGELGDDDAVGAQDARGLGDERGELTRDILLLLPGRDSETLSISNGPHGVNPLAAALCPLTQTDLIFQLAGHGADLCHDVGG